MKLTRRGEIVVGISLVVTALTTLYGLALVMDHINWVGDHFCFQSSIVCYGLDK